MKRFFLLVIACAFLSDSCNKTVSSPITYSVSNDATNTTVEDIYIPSTGTYIMNTEVKLIQGQPNQDDNVELVIAGVPANVTLSPATYNAIPTYTEGFTFTATGAAEGVYPATITAHTHSGAPTVYNFNIHVIPPDCATLFAGILNGSSACSSRQFTSSAVGTSAGTGVLTINNFGGYGSACNVTVNFNCDNTTVSIANANYGNGVILQGSGTFNSDSMVINYTASSIPQGGSETCTVVYKP